MKTAVFISPHLDDAWFSAGALMLRLQHQGFNLKVMNVFTRAGELPQTYSAKTFLRQVSGATVRQLYYERQQEDQAVFAKHHIATTNLDFIEALWRKKPRYSLLDKTVGALLPEFLHVYPTYRWHIIKGQVSALDTSLISEIAQTLSKQLETDDLIFCPLGIGDHVDHLVVRQACEQLQRPLIYWADIPYKDRHAVAENAASQSLSTNLSSCFFHDPKLLAEKATTAELYRSQYTAVFAEKPCQEIDEAFYGKPDIIAELQAYAKT